MEEAILEHDDQEKIFSECPMTNNRLLGESAPQEIRKVMVTIRRSSGENMEKNDFKKILRLKNQEFQFYDITELGWNKIGQLPFSLRIFLENLIRQSKDHYLRSIQGIVNNTLRLNDENEVLFFPTRILMNDLTGFPSLVDLAATRDAVLEKGGDPRKVDPAIPLVLIMDHIAEGLANNEKELNERPNPEQQKLHERCQFLQWAKKTFHHLNIISSNNNVTTSSYLAELGEIVIESFDEKGVLFPDTVVGTDPHISMINSLGILGWGVGGVEAQAIMLGHPHVLSLPKIIGMKLLGKLKPHVTIVDAALAIADRLSQFGVVDQFVEFVGPGVQTLSVLDRAMVSKIVPHCGAMLGFFPVDEVTIDFFCSTKRKPMAEIIEAYCRANELFQTGDVLPQYRALLEFDLDNVLPYLSGLTPSQERVRVEDIKSSLEQISSRESKPQVDIEADINNQSDFLFDGAITSACVTNCDRVSTPALIIGSALLAKKAYELGLVVPFWVKTSLVLSTSFAATYLEKTHLLDPFQKLGFDIVLTQNTPCQTCLADLHPPIEQDQKNHDFYLIGVTSNHCHFQHAHLHIKALFLASPLLVVAFALSGRIDQDLANDPLGIDSKGNVVFFKDIWPSEKEINGIVEQCLPNEKPAFFQQAASTDDCCQKSLSGSIDDTYKWNNTSLSFQQSFHIKNIPVKPDKWPDVDQAYCLLNLGDNIPAHHIYPSQNTQPFVEEQSLASKEDEAVSDGFLWNKHKDIARNTFSHFHITNKLLDFTRGPYTIKFPEKQKLPIYDAAMAYQAEKNDLIILAGKNYGMNFDHDWAAKGTRFLGVRAVIAQSFGRMHRSNLIGMGVLPLTFLESQNVDSLGLSGHELFFIKELHSLTPKSLVTVEVKNENGLLRSFHVRCRLDTELEVKYFYHRGILPYILRELLS